MRIHSILGLALLSFAIACKGDVKPGDAASGSAASANAASETGDPHELVGKLDVKAVETMEQRNGTWAEGDATSTWRAYISDNAVRRIDESMLLTGGATGALVHYFTPSGRLILTSERRAVMVQNKDRSPTESATLRVFGFVGDSASSLNKIVDGVVTQPEKYEIDAARAHALAIFELAKTAASAQKRP